ncbi:GMP synthase [glutamine-hydrolyzing]-like [Lucilia cuprina]|uniref:GMP synthase [glutamine-hydrolyzing]-like n=1 Tax=Lucilia cuprina TaxID=7375 RepID=UPI001F0706F4|nr:GMP synthase [glutamine-hydrolyzing]-like [Lucilia cuprina]
MLIIKRFKPQITKYKALKGLKCLHFNYLQRYKATKTVCLPEKIAILDAGSQYIKLIKRKVEQLGIANDILPLETTACCLNARNYKAIIISGGPHSVYAKNAPPYDAKIFQLKIPILGICYGMQMLNQVFGGSIEKTSVREDGQYQVDLDIKCKLFQNLFQKQIVLLTHGDSVVKVGDNLKISARSEKNLIAAIANDDLQLYGVQFHPEAKMSRCGGEIFKNFLYKICGLKSDLFKADVKTQILEYIKKRVEDKKVVLLISGGLDSCVCAVLLREVLGAEQILAVHIDNGFLRNEECESVEIFLKTLEMDLIKCEEFLKFLKSSREIKHLKGAQSPKAPLLCETLNPEDKRLIIGNTFVNITQELLKQLQLKNDKILWVQGSLESDLIESGCKDCSNLLDTIKTHQNDTKLVRQLRNEGRLIEPLSQLNKDEVRKLAKELKIPKAIRENHPFPGCGLAIRIICAQGPFKEKDFDETQQMVAYIVNYRKHLTKNDKLMNNLKNNLTKTEQKELLRITCQNQLQACLLPLRSVGVQGDGRSYKYVLGLSSCQEPNWCDLFYLAQLIPTLLHNINRVCYIFGKVNSQLNPTITTTLVNKENLKLLRQADKLANDLLRTKKTLS